ncbi:hypothetical protein DPMN_135621 [Dreissena polymorpha]|uniref:Uncharacterized protein n=1 Tax=Dreissena polymorpha TaxID=45954 RepID=A0A9D4FZI6_DREPO|nr:hypothetical protein DPMN_135621 [Dreissena polymorpha]
MLTKDSSELKELIKDFVLQLKEEMLGSLVLRIEKVESELFDKEIENGKLAKEIETLGKSLKAGRVDISHNNLVFSTTRIDQYSSDTF